MATAAPMPGGRSCDNCRLAFEVALFHVALPDSVVMLDYRSGSQSYSARHAAARSRHFDRSGRFRRRAPGLSRSRRVRRHAHAATRRCASCSFAMDARRSRPIRGPRIRGFAPISMTTRRRASIRTARRRKNCRTSSSELSAIYTSTKPRSTDSAKALAPQCRTHRRSVVRRSAARQSAHSAAAHEGAEMGGRRAHPLACRLSSGDRELSPRQASRRAGRRHPDEARRAKRA